MLIPMPSPNGTNYERLFIGVTGRANAAYDSAQGLSTPIIDQLMLLLRGKLNAADFADLETLLETFSAAEDEPATALDARPWRRPVKGPAGRSFNERYPDAARIKTM